MNQIKEGAKEVRTNMTFIQEFLQKKHGVEILFFVIILGGFITAIAFYNKGEENGSESAKEEVQSLKNAIINDAAELRNINQRLNYYQKRLDSCNNSSLNSNLEQLVTKKLEEAERIKNILKTKNESDKKDINTINTIEKLIKK